MKIQILGPGCPKCVTLAENVKRTVKEFKIEAEVEKVSDITKIMGQGILLTPGLVIDGKVVSSGKVLGVHSYLE